MLQGTKFVGGGVEIARPVGVGARGVFHGAVEAETYRVGEAEVFLWEDVGCYSVDEEGVVGGGFPALGGEVVGFLEVGDVGAELELG